MELLLDVWNDTEGTVKVNLIEISCWDLWFGWFESSMDVEFLSADPTCVSETIDLTQNVPSFVRILYKFEKENGIFGINLKFCSSNREALEK